MLIIPEIKLIFIHIPKSGGSSLNSCILTTQYNLYTTGRIKSKQNNSLVLYNCKNSSEYFKIEDFNYSKTDLAHVYNDLFYSLKKQPGPNLDEYNRFIFVRNPYKRLLSAYQYKFNHLKKEDFFHLLNSLSNSDFTDKKFIHLMPQFNFYKVNDIVFKLETFYSEENKIINLFNSEIKFFFQYLKEHASVTNKAKKKISLEEFYDNESLQLVNKIYKKDFLLFEYDIKEVI